MKTNPPHGVAQTACLRPLLAAFGLILCAVPQASHANLLVANFGANTIGSYTDAGLTINTRLINGLDGPQSMTFAAGRVYVANGSGTSVGVYTTNGAAVNASLVSGLTDPSSITISGNRLFVLSRNASDYPVVGEYNATTGAMVDADFLPILANPDYAPSSIAVFGDYIYVTDNTNARISRFTTSGVLVNQAFITLAGAVGKPVNLTIADEKIYVTVRDSVTLAGGVALYSTSGETLNSSLITGISAPFGIAVSGSDLFVTSKETGTVGKYTTAGATVNASLISGLNSPTGIIVVPEPRTVLLLSLAFAFVLFRKVRSARGAIKQAGSQ